MTGNTVSELEAENARLRDELASTKGQVDRVLALVGDMRPPVRERVLAALSPVVVRPHPNGGSMITRRS